MKVRIAQFLLEECQFGHRPDYLAVPHNSPIPETGVDLEIGLERAEDDRSKVLVRLRAKTSEGAMYRFVVVYVAVMELQFDADESPPEDLDKRLMVTAATMLFPFIRELVASLTSKGRFGPTWLAPVNFTDVVSKSTPQAELAAAPR